MNKKLLPIVMIMTIFLVVPTGLPPAFADFPICTTSTLENDELYVSAAQGFLFKVKGSDGHACVVGKIVTALGVGAVGVECDDIAIDHSNSKLYCLRDGTHLYEVSRSPVGAPPELLATLKGQLRIGSTVGPIIDQVNAMEISSDGTAYAASGENDSNPVGCGACQGGLLFTVDLSNGVLTQIASFGDKFRSAGDLALDESASPDDLFWTVKCRELGEAGAPVGTCDDPNDDALFRIDIEGPTLVFIKDLGDADVFAMEFVNTGDPNLCFLTMGGLIFETRLDGTRIMGAGENYPSGTGTTFVQGTGASVPAFGGTANFVGGSLIMIDKVALIVAGIETNASWLILFMISGVAVVAYQFTSNNNTKNQKHLKY